MWRRMIFRIFFTIVFIVTVFGFAISTVGCKKSDSHEKPEIAATNSYLEAAVRDLLGNDIPVLRLAGPGMCPGHFDIRPSQVQKLRNCRMLLRFDFQKGLESKLSNLSEDGLRFIEICVPGGLCEPPSYLSTCQQIAKILIEAGMLTPQRADERLAEINRRIDKKQKWCRQQLSGFTEIPVISSVHQEAFCRWLGLKVVATFSGADVGSVNQIDRAVCTGEKAGVKLVIANLPEGRKVADSLAKRLGANVVVFRNFPAANGVDCSFDDLLTSNVSELAKEIGR